MLGTETLKIKAKTEDLIKYAYCAFAHFPKSEKFTLVADLKRSLVRILELEIRANYARDKMPYLRDLDVELDVFRSIVRLSMDLGFMPFKKYEVLSIHVAEVGRMLGGLIKRAKAGVAA